MNNTKNNFKQKIENMNKSELEDLKQELEISLSKGRIIISQGANPYGTKGKSNRINIKMIKYFIQQINIKLKK